MYKRLVALAVLVLVLTSCGNTKYNYHFERGRMIDFTRGEWILNRSYTNYHEERINKIALREFNKILGDSLFFINNIENRGTVPLRMPLDPSKEELAALKMATGMDYLINVQSNMIKNEMNSFAHAPDIGRTTKTNEAGITIKIYNLNTQSIISESNLTGTAKVTKTEDDNSWDCVNNAETLSMQGVKKLIRKYRKYGITE